MVYHRVDAIFSGALLSVSHTVFLLSKVLNEVSTGDSLRYSLSLEVFGSGLVPFCFFLSCHVSPSWPVGVMWSVWFIRLVSHIVEYSVIRSYLKLGASAFLGVHSCLLGDALMHCLSCVLVSPFPCFCHDRPSGSGAGNGLSSSMFICCWATILRFLVPLI